jgi:hypothetical protein
MKRFAIILAIVQMIFAFAGVTAVKAADSDADNAKILAHLVASAKCKYEGYATHISSGTTDTYPVFDKPASIQVACAGAAKSVPYCFSTSITCTRGGFMSATFRINNVVCRAEEKNGQSYCPSPAACISGGVENNQLKFTKNSWTSMDNGPYTDVKIGNPKGSPR